MADDVDAFRRTDEVTPYWAYLSRRQWLRAAVAAGTVAATGVAYRALRGPSGRGAVAAPLADVVRPSTPTPDTPGPPPLDEPLTSEEAITHYNNFYEFSTDKAEVAAIAADFSTAGWTVTVDGLVDKPRTFTLDELRGLGPIEERIYRMRCVEAWSMVIPWAGLPLARLIEAVGVKPEAKFVAFETLLDPARMPGQKSTILRWPYVEGLRLDEATHPLTLLAVGLYGKELPPQDGAPVRLVVPWKYGFKGIKSIVRISFVAEMPPTSWNRFAAGEYGFYANVNPAVDHPRWSQASERRIGELFPRKTLPFNGYGDQVASLYDGMDLSVWF